MANPGPAFLTVPEVAKHYRVDPDTVRAWIRSGLFAAIDISPRVGGRARYRIPATALAEFEARRTVRPPIPKRTVNRRAEPAGFRKYF